MQRIRNALNWTISARGLRLGERHRHAAVTDLRVGECAIIVACPWKRRHDRRPADVEVDDHREVMTHAVARKLMTNARSAEDSASRWDGRKSAFYAFRGMRGLRSMEVNPAPFAAVQKPFPFAISALGSRQAKHRPVEDRP
ncbi:MULTISPECIES: hypothetical protein [unclassified Bradyrhizobium]|uniref:hypothetical protein n=1 Tax=unclassified Bradyrhizobium TaxID=2631580 RepID=UPI00247918FA|nr:MULTISPECIES: hypothetical protein [unclassified Bradyrhizobium]WGS17438.1 hypothetical protein MTX22_22565 [Bradyrhizobium sp. ISRA463]WGS24214.1 hypothetical protein MTX19_20230 [Bradyrhizobium sp. ISRA464]